MNLRNLHFYHYRGFEDLRITFSREAKIIVFIGENGCGKTSLIEGISMLLRDTLFKHHRYDRVNWGDTRNIHTAFPSGRIEVEVEGARRTYTFNQNLRANRFRFTTEDRLSLDLNRDPTPEELMQHYEAQAGMAFEAELYDKAIIEYQKLAALQEKELGADSFDLARTYHNIGSSYANTNRNEEGIVYYQKSLAIKEKQLPLDDKALAITYYNMGLTYGSLKNYEEALVYFQKGLGIQEKIVAPNDSDLANMYSNMGLNFFYLKRYSEAETYYQKALSIQETNELRDEEALSRTYHNLGVAYLNWDKYDKADEFLQKALAIHEKILDSNNPSLLLTYNNLARAYTGNGNTEKAIYYKEKAQGSTAEGSSQRLLPELYRNETDDLKHFNEYIEALIPVVLHYSPRFAAVEEYKDALPMAFRIPMTTNFDMILDWFIEYENDENRKRLRSSNPDYRSPELEAIRAVITEGLTLLNEGKLVFSELQTEINETVKDGQVTTWLSIKKGELRVNVQQLSDGEKRVLILLIDLTRRLLTAAKRNNIQNYREALGLVLIDEIEQHLHPKWQRTILPTLHHLFPKLQFVATTHSPLVVSHLLRNKKATEIEQVGKIASVYYLTDKKASLVTTIGRDVATTLSEFFGVERRPALYQAKIDALFAAFEEDEPDFDALKEQLSELRLLLGENDPDVKSAESIINDLSALYQ